MSRVDLRTPVSLGILSVEAASLAASTSKKVALESKSVRVDGNTPVATKSVSPQLDPFDLPIGPASAITAALQVGQWNRAGAKLITASDVETKLDSVPLAMRALMKDLTKALGHDGPLGSHGPLSRLGPVSDEPWSPSFWMKDQDWSDLSKDMALIETGFLDELKGGGMFAPLGPLGPLGALGALGYLGLVGGHGYARNADGHFIDKQGEIVKTAVIGASKKAFELVELYPEKVAKAARIHDASWIIKGAISKDDNDGDAYQFMAKKKQVVTLTVVPEHAGDVLTIELVQKGKVIGRSDSSALVNWIHFEADKNGPIEVRVNKKEGAKAPPQSASSTYIDWMLSPLVAWGEAVRPWVGAPAAQEGTGYRLYAVSTPSAS